MLIWQIEPGDHRLRPWEKRLGELEAELDPVDQLLAEIESAANGTGDPIFEDPNQLELFKKESTMESHQIRLFDGHVFRGSWYEIVRQMRDYAGFSHETVLQYMKRLAERWHEQLSVQIPSSDPEGFLRAAIGARLITLEDS